jgi:hypothetical protein
MYLIAPDAVPDVMHPTYEYSGRKSRQIIAQGTGFLPNTRERLLFSLRLRAFAVKNSYPQ